MGRPMVMVLGLGISVLAALFPLPFDDHAIAIVEVRRRHISAGPADLGSTTLMIVRRRDPVQILADVAVAAGALTSLENELVAALGPQVLNALLVRPGLCPGAGPHNFEH